MNLTLNKTKVSNKKYHIPKIFLVDAKNKILGHLTSKIVCLLSGKDTNFYNSAIDQGNYVVVINSNYIKVSGLKTTNKYYYKSTQRPGNLKFENFYNLLNKNSNRIIEEAVKGMLPKTKQGRNLFRRLYVYKDTNIKYKFNDKFSIDKYTIHK